MYGYLGCAGAAIEKEMDLREGNVDGDEKECMNERVLKEKS